MKKYGIISFDTNTKVLAEVNIIGEAPASECVAGYAIRAITSNIFLNIELNKSFIFLIDKVAEFESDDDAKLWFEMERL